VATTSIVSASESERAMEGEGGCGEVGFGDVAMIGWGRVVRRVRGVVGGVE